MNSRADGAAHPNKARVPKNFLARPTEDHSDPTVQFVIGKGGVFPHAGDLQLQPVPEVVAEVHVARDVRDVGFSSYSSMCVPKVVEQCMVERRATAHVGESCLSEGEQGTVHVLGRRDQCDAAMQPNATVR